MKISMATLIVSLSLVAAGCASSQPKPDQESHGGGTKESMQENSLSNPISRINMQIGAPECDVR